MLHMAAFQYTQCATRSILPVKDSHIQLPRGLGALSYPGSAANPLTELFQYRTLLVTSTSRHLYICTPVPITTPRDDNDDDD